MIRVYIVLAALMLTAASAMAQTKRIAHRSHSGSNASFSNSRGSDDYGLDTRRMERYKKLSDSVSASQRRKNVHGDSVYVKPAGQKQRIAPKPVRRQQQGNQ